MKPPIPTCENQICGGQRQGRGKVERIQAAKVVDARQRGRLIGKLPIHFDHVECRTLNIEFFDRRRSPGQANRPGGFDEPDAADEPAISIRHRAAYEFAALLGYVALDQRAGIEIEVQRSWSRSEMTAAEALVDAWASVGGQVGRALDATVSRPSETSRSSSSSPALSPTGTMSAIGRPRKVTLIGRPPSTRRKVWLSDAFNSRTPTSRMWSPYHAM